MWHYFVMGIIFFGVGLSLHVFKWYFLISGYNTMSKEKKARVNTAGLGRLLGLYFYVNGGVLFLMGILQAVGAKTSMMPLFVFFGISTGYVLLKAQKYDGNLYDEHGKMRKGAWKQLALVVGIVVIIGCFVVVLLFFSAQATKVTFLEEGIEIHGIYGEIYTWDSMDHVALMEELPTIEKRTNGSALGSNLKGYFKTTEWGEVKMFVNTQEPPFVYLEMDDRVMVFNMDNAAETKETYRSILKKMSSGM